MLRRKKTHDPDSAWKLQNSDQRENQIYAYINLQQQGRLVDVYRDEGVDALERLIRSELKQFLYNEGQGRTICKPEFVRWRDKIHSKMSVSILVGYMKF